MCFPPRTRSLQDYPSLQPLSRRPLQLQVEVPSLYFLLLHPAYLLQQELVRFHDTVLYKPADSTQSRCLLLDLKKVGCILVCLLNFAPTHLHCCQALAFCCDFHLHHQHPDTQSELFFPHLHHFLHFRSSVTQHPQY